MTLKLGFSPCPNDTFIFDALVNNKIDTGGLSFDVVMDDVQTLNEMAMAGRLDVTKISYGSVPLVLRDYMVLDAGSALGMGVGPLLISTFPLPAPAVTQCTIAIPGKHTTAHVLFSLAFPEAIKKVFLRYDEIEQYVLSNTGSLENIQGVKLGVIIHESRFTYQDKGLVKQTDLGRYWEEETGFPLPLGGIVAKRSLPPEIIHQTDRLIRQSLEHAHRQGEGLSEFVRSHAQEMDTQVMRQHIGLYVNEYTLSLGAKGREAVKKFVQVHSAINKIPVALDQLFAS